MINIILKNMSRGSVDIQESKIKYSLEPTKCELFPIPQKRDYKHSSKSVTTISSFEKLPKR